MIEENITTALIMESDADWDLRIHDILPGVATGAKQIADYPFAATDHPRDLSIDASPYGDNWDILWIGHCGSHPGGSGRVYHFNDTTVPDEEHENTFVGRPRRKLYPEGSRLVFEFHITICTTAYAISHKGAVKMLKYLEESNLNIDVRMQALCEMDPALTCLATWPQVMSAAPSESNIKHPDGEKAPGSDTDSLDDGASAGPAIEISARRNAKLVLEGQGRDKWIKEW